MVTRKAILKQGNNVLLPITRAENVLDQDGSIALHSQHFIASENKPGLITPTEKENIKKAVLIQEDVPTHGIVQLSKINKDKSQKVFPITKAEAVIVTVNNKQTSLDKVIALDTYPKKGSTQGVTSNGVWQHIDDTVGEIHRKVIQI